MGFARLFEIRGRRVTPRCGQSAAARVPKSSVKWVNDRDLRNSRFYWGARLQDRAPQVSGNGGGDHIAMANARLALFVDADAQRAPLYGGGSLDADWLGPRPEQGPDENQSGQVGQPLASPPVRAGGTAQGGRCAGRARID